MIDHTLAPGAPKDRVGTARENNRIFDRDDALIIVTVQSPGLKLSPAETSLMHHQMEGMLVVITFLADDAQLRA